MVDDRHQTTMIELLKKHGDNLPFWRFVDNFSNTVGFERDLASNTKFAELVLECDRQYEYLKSAHPAYFQMLTERKGGEFVMLGAITNWAVAVDVPIQHFAGLGSVRFVENLEEKRTAKAAEKQMAITPANENASVIAPSESADNPAPAEETPLADAGFIPRYTLDQLIKQAEMHYASKLGHIIRVNEYGDPAGYYRGSGDSAAFTSYDLAMVIETPSTEIAIAERDYEGHPMVRSTWSIKMLTGPIKGNRAFIHSACFYADGSVTGEGMELTTGSTIGNIMHPKLSDMDLLNAMWAELEPMVGTEVYAKAFMAYVGDGDTQDHFSFDPPVKVTLDPLTWDQVAQRAQMRSYDVDNDVLDIDIDFSFPTDDPRVENLRAGYFSIASYFQNGSRAVYDIAEGYQPEATDDAEVRGPGL